MTTGARVGVILLQLGTPDGPTPRQLRSYLRQFLLDRRVVDLPRLQWWPILHLAVLPTRPVRSARLYQRVWTPEGSPLAVISAGQAAGLERGLTQDSETGLAGAPIVVAVGMRYGNPSIASTVNRLIDAGCDRLLAFPMYPQYASATTGSSLETLFGCLAPRRVVPPVRVVPPYFEDPSYIAALAASARGSLAGRRVDHLVISFHGLPKRYATLGDPYPEQCHHTAQALAHELDWPADRLTVTFQSRFGREEWLQPYTDETIRVLATRSLERVAVICPGFTADCLETLEEIAITGQEQYRDAGGRGDYCVVPCVNDSAPWIDAMTQIAKRELRGWV